MGIWERSLFIGWGVGGFFFFFFFFFCGAGGGQDLKHCFVGGVKHFVCLLLFFQILLGGGGHRMICHILVVEVIAWSEKLVGEYLHFWLQCWIAATCDQLFYHCLLFLWNIRIKPQEHINSWGINEEIKLCVARKSLENTVSLCKSGI